MMLSAHRVIAVGICAGLLAVIAWSRSGLAQDSRATGKGAATQSPAKKGVARCTLCHNEYWRYPVWAIFQSKHAVMADQRTPFADGRGTGAGACETCHGVSDNHVANAVAMPPKVVFRGENANPASEQNQVCLACHRSGLRMHWKGSLHESSDVGCAACHQIHTGRDRVLDKITQPEVCFGCHKAQREQINRISHHPIKEGKIACSQCHNPHGSAGPMLLLKTTLNETCFTHVMRKSADRSCGNIRLCGKIASTAIRRTARSTALPDLKTRLNGINLYAKYRLQNHAALKVNILHQKFDSADWGLDNVVAATTPLVLNTGQSSPRNSVTVIGFSLSYRYW